jgi:peptidoglycan/LPS O-acetylase OafA/YrhL
MTNGAPTFAELSRGRANNFDFLRCVLAGLVILSHSFPLLHGDNDGEVFARLTGGQTTGGELAVNGFFILSGFLIAQSWQNSRSAASYLKKRVLRIYPGFVAAVLFCALVVGPYVAASAADYWRNFEPAPFALHTLNLDFTIDGDYPHLRYKHLNGSLWSIRYEFLCYLALVALGVAGAFRRRWLVVAAFLVCLGVFAAQVYFGIKIPGSRYSVVWCFPGFWPRLASCFLAGVVFYQFRERVRQSLPLFLACLAGLLLLALLPHLKALLIALPLLGGYAFFYLAFLPTPALHRFAKHGDFSYGLYLYAFPVQQLLVHHFGPALSPWGLFAAALPLTAGMAVVSWHLVEKPFLALKGRPKVSAGSP